MSVRRDRELAEQTRLWAAFERRILPSMARLETRHLRLTASAFERGGVIAADLTLDENALQPWFQLLVRHDTSVTDMFSRRSLERLGEPIVNEEAKAIDAPTFREILSQWITTRGLTEAKRLVGTTKTVVRELIATLEDEGLGVEEIARRIRKDAPKLGLRRSVAIARTETHTAASFANQEAARQTDRELSKTWLAHPPGRTRETHLAANGQTRIFDEPYEVGSSLLMFPGDPSLGAAAEEVVQCRCAEIHEPV